MREEACVVFLTRKATDRCGLFPLIFELVRPLFVGTIIL